MKFSPPSLSSPRETRPVSMIMRRRIKSGRLREFERGLQQFVTFAASFPGHLELCVAHYASCPQRNDYLVIDRFIDAQTRQAFTATSHYRAWLRLVIDFTENIPTENEPIELNVDLEASSFSHASAPLASFNHAFPSVSGRRSFHSGNTVNRSSQFFFPRLLTALFSLASTSALIMVVIDAISPAWHPFARSVFAVGMIFPALTAGLWSLAGDFRKTLTAKPRS